MHAAWWWIDRWRKSTAYTDMTLAEMGAYRNLLDELWLRQGALPADDRILGRIAGSELEWPVVREAVLKHFVRVNGEWRNATHDEVMTKTLQIQKVRSDVGKLGNEKRWAEHRKGLANKIANESQDTSQIDSQNISPPSPSPSPSPSPDTVSVKTNTRSRAPRAVPVDPEFDLFWQAYPRKVGKDAARKAWAKRHPDADMIDAMKLTLTWQITTEAWTKEGGRFIPHPATWLNQGRWQDEPPNETAIPSQPHGKAMASDGGMMRAWDRKFGRKP